MGLVLSDGVGDMVNTLWAMWPIAQFYIPSQVPITNVSAELRT